MLFRSLRASGRNQEAITRYEAALRLQPVAPDLHYKLALSLRNVGRTEEARQHYDRARQLDSRVPEIIWKN